MSIISEITRINNNIAAAYSVCERKGAVLPVRQNSANLSAAIDSISGSGGIEDTVTYAQTNEMAAAYLAEVNYNPSDYTDSKISSYASAATSYRKDRSKGVTIRVPSSGILMLCDVGGTISTEVTAGSYTIYNLTPESIASYIIRNSSDQIVSAGLLKPTGTLRMINGGGNTFNIRDLGGWACDGGKLDYGKIFRGCELNGDNYHITLTDEQKYLFTDFLGIRDEIDLRGNSEVDGDDQTYGTDDDITSSALGDSVDYVRYPIVAYANGMNLSNAVYTANYANLIKQIASDLSAGRPMYIHCMQGADRTGTICALIEGICGVSQSDIDMDYELTTFAGQGTRRRSGSDYKGMIELINSFEGETFRDKILYYMLNAGVTIDEINTIRRCLINGTPTDLVEPDRTEESLPAEYQKVEYLGSSGTQTIQIEFPSDIVGAYLEMDIMRVGSGSRGLIGSANTNSATIGAAAGSYFGWDSGGKYEMGGSSISSITSNTADYDHLKFQWYAAYSGKLTVNGTEATSRSGTGAYTKWNIFGGSSYPVSCRMKEVMVYAAPGGAVLTAHLIPCYRKSDNIAGMYDVVGNSFLTNIGTGSFTVGDPVTE